MSRPKPTVLLQSMDAKTYKAEQVLASDAIYAVFYEGRPINLRSLQTVIDDGPKYKKCSFSNRGHAFNLSQKLNTLFKTNKFSVVMLTSGTVITED
jgi:hypothetical protein